MKTEYHLIKNKKTYFKNYSFNLNKRCFINNYLENDKIYKGIFNKTSKLKKSNLSSFIINKKIKNVKLT